MKLICKILPWFFLALFGSEIIAVLVPKQDKDGEFHVREFGKLPVLLNGRIQPFDSVGHNSLLQIRSTADVPLEEVPSWQFWHHPQKLSSTAWLLEVMCRPDLADERPIFLIHHPELLGELNIANIGVEKSGLRYYTFNQIVGQMPTIMTQASKAPEKEQEQTPLQKQVLKLANALVLYEQLKTTLHPRDVDNLGAELDKVQAAIAPGVQAVIAKDEGKPFNQQDFDRIMDTVNRFDDLQKASGAGQQYPLVIPPIDPELARDAWGNIGFGVLESVKARTIIPPLRWLQVAAESFKKGDVATFNTAVHDYSGWLKDNFPAQWAKGRHEFTFNQLKLFLHAMIMYIFAFLLACASLTTMNAAGGLSESLRRSAFYVILLAWVVHTTGLIYRMVLEGRPPVTNLYSSAIFIGFGAVVLGILLERVYRIGIGNLVASLAGFVTLIIAHNLALGGDTMEMMRAVLDTNFWLATHVVVVTLGYASTFVAGLLGVTYIIVGVFTPYLTRAMSKRSAIIAGAAASLAVKKKGYSSIKAAGEVYSAAATGELGKALTRMIYGIVCFATLFSFVGTVLGGIWADQSWGRFWGWDPKENGALIIVLWNVIILHARWGGLVRERGLANLAVFGNIVTSWSWFGVNMLGIGLHSYGFMDAAFQWLRGFIALQLLIIGLGLLPRKYWRSFQSQPQPVTPTPPAPGAKPARAAN